MRILVWQWGRFGAGPRLAFEGARALSQVCDFDVILSLAEGAEIMRTPACREAVDLPLHTYASSAEFLRRTLRIKEVIYPIVHKLQDDRPDVALITMMGYWDIFLVRALKKMEVPVVCMVHDAQVHPGDQFHLANWLQRLMLRMSDGIVTFTDFVARQLKSFGASDTTPYATVPLPAFDYMDLQPPPAHIPECTAERPLRLLMAGRLKRYKGLGLLADAITLLGNDVPVHFRIVGKPQGKHDLLPLESLPGIEFDLGWKSDAELINHLDWADAAVLPYIEASQSGIPPLAFSRARAVIATPVGGLPEQIEDGRVGVLAKDVSAAALADAIGALVADRSLVQRYGKNALSYAENEIGWNAIAPRLASFLEMVASRSWGKRC